jgi:hypothetical protein
MTEGYEILAYSASQNQEIRWFNLHDMKATTDAVLAQQQADFHAAVLNQQQKLMAADWQGRIRWNQFGEQTLIDAMNRRATQTTGTLDQ